MSLHSLELPDYREQAPEVAARFAKIRQRPVVLSVRGLRKDFGATGSAHTVFDNVSLDIHRREFITVIGPSRLRKIDLHPHRRRARRRDQRRDSARWQTHPRPRPGPRHGLPGLHALPVAHGEAERDVRPRNARRGQLRRRVRSPAVARHGRPFEIRELLPARADRRHEAARRHRPRARERAAHSDHGRALRRARRADPRARCRATCCRFGKR